MYKIEKLLLAAMLFIGTAGAQDNHVVLISIDGLRPEFYKEAGWSMVHLRQAMKQGSYAEGVQGVFPSVTYPSHTTMVTGVQPAKHGVYYNTPPEPAGVTGTWNWNYDTIKVPTIFSLAKEKGLSTASFLWPVSVDAPSTYNIPEYWYLPKVKGAPRDMTHALSDKAKPAGFYEELKAKAIGDVQEIDFDGDYLSIDDHLARMACYTIRTKKPHFLAIHLVTLDHFQHVEGRDGDKVRAAIAVVDNAVFNIMEAVEKAGLTEQTTFIITGDHGFVDIHTALHPNVWLAQAGLYDPEHPEKSRAYFHAAGASSFLLLTDETDTKTSNEVLALLKGLPPAVQKGFEIKDREDLATIGANPQAAVALAAQKGYTFGNSATGDVSRPAKGGTHGYYPDFKEIETGFIAFGNGIKQGVLIPKMGLVDIAPLVAHLLRIELPDTDGKLHTELLK